MVPPVKLFVCERIAEPLLTARDVAPVMALAALSVSAPPEIVMGAPLTAPAALNPSVPAEIVMVPVNEFAEASVAVPPTDDCVMAPLPEMALKMARPVSVRLKISEPLSSRLPVLVPMSPVVPPLPRLSVASG